MAPVITSGASGSVAENAATSTVVYTATATDAESDALTYALTGTDAASFSIDTAGAVRLLSPANFEVKSSYSLTINVRDATHTTTQAVTLNVTDVNEAPSDISLSNSSVAENTATASALTIGSLSSIDPDAGNTFTYSIVGGADQARFQLSGANLQFQGRHHAGLRNPKQLRRHRAQHRPGRAELRQGLDHQPEQRQRKTTDQLTCCAKRHPGRRHRADRHQPG